MTAALIHSGSVLGVWDTIPNPLTLPNGDAVHCAAVGWTDGAYSLVPANYTDTPPNGPAQVTSTSYAIVGGAVQITRAWQGLPTSVPLVITNAQARAVLMATPSPANPGKTLYDDVNAFVTAAAGLDQMAWEYSNTLSRDSSLVAAMGAQAKLSQTQIDALFVQAAQIGF